MKMMTMVFLIILLIVLFTGQQLYLEGESEAEMQDILTDLSWNETMFEVVHVNSSLNLSNQTRSFLQGSIFRFVNIVGWFSFEATKIGVQYGYHNPQFDYEFLWRCFLWLLYMTIAIGVLVNLVPLLAALYLLGLGFWKAISWLWKVTFGRWKNES